MHHHFSIWKTTILGGIIFLLPFAIVVFLLGQLAQIIYSAAAHLDDAIPLPQWTVGGVSAAVVLVTLALLLLCYLAGLAARLSFSRRFSETIERNLLLLFPRYVVWKSQLAANVGVDAAHPGMHPVVVALDDHARIGFEIERAAGGGRVTVYLPGSPDPWTGFVIHVTAERVKPLPLGFHEATALCERMGRGACGALEALQRETS
jgi:uncharacterized membrane protein